MSFSAMATMSGSLPPNARYITHRNECYDWGTLGWLLTTKQVGALGPRSGTRSMAFDAHTQNAEALIRGLDWKPELPRSSNPLLSRRCYCAA